MTLMEAVIARKSIRSYHMEEIDADILEKIVDFISELNPPYGGIDWDFDILPFDDMCTLVGGRPRLEAPHYLVLRSEKNKGCLQNAGYLGEMAVLYMTTLGIATCWQGGLECEHDFPNCLPYITAVAFGYSDEPFRTSAAEIKRKKMSSVAAGELKDYKGPIVEAARLAPSSMGMQPCRFTALQNRINVYRKKHFIRFPAISYAQCMDVGVSIAHIDAAARAAGYDIKAEKQEPEPIWGKNIYQATIHLSKQEEQSTQEQA